MHDVCDCHSEGFSGRKVDLQAMILQASGLSELFKALSDETRTRILFLLSAGELCVCDMAELLHMSLPAISHHLRLLRIMRLATARKEGKQVMYRLADDHVLQLIKVAQEHFAEETI